MPTSTEKRVGVIGADSFLGTHLVPALQAKGMMPVSLVPYTSDREVFDPVRLYDPYDAGSLAKALEGLPVAIDASCWVASGMDVPRARGAGVRRARALTGALEKAGTARCIFVSDLATLGDADEVDASSFYVPGTTSNAAIEAAWALEVELYRGVGAGVDIPIVLPSMMVGPGDHGRDCSLIVGMQAGDLPVLPAGRVEVVDVRDLARSVVTAIESGRSGRRYPVSAGSIAVEELAAIISEATGSDPSRAVERRFPGAAARGLEFGLSLFGRRIAIEEALRHVRAGRVRDSKARGELSFVARPLRDSLSDALSWYTEAFGWTRSG